MTMKAWVISAVIVLASSATAGAQDDNQWLASGFVGSNFANNAQPASMNFGGSLAYLWRNMYGAEFDTGFTPNFQLQSNFFGLGIKPAVDSYMANAIVAKPFGGERQVQPFVSGGIGAIALRSGLDLTSVSGGPMAANDTRFGGDIGGGILAFSGMWGVKADVRYFRAAGSYNTTVPPTAAAANPPTTPTPAPGPGYVTPSSMPAGTTAATAPTPAAASTSADTTSLAGAALSGLHFWRANIGLALRW